MYVGFVEAPSKAEPAALMSHLAECLRRVGAEGVTLEGLIVRFQAPERGVGRWHILAPFDSGELAFDPAARGVVCRASIRGLVVSSTYTIGLAVVAVMLVSPAPFAWAVFPLGWLWLVGVNVFVGVPRLQMHLEDSAASEFRSAGSQT